MLIYILKMILMSLFTYYFNIKILNINTRLSNKNKFLFFTFILSFSTLLGGIGKVKEIDINSVIYIIFIVATIFSMHTKNEFGYSILITSISLSINQVVFFVSTILSFVPYMFFKINNVYINFIAILIIYLTIITKLPKIKRIKNGFSFLNKNSKNDFFNIIILSSSSIILFTVILLSNYKEKVTVNLMLALILFSIIMFVTIQKSLQLYYKQKMLVKDLEETKAELEEKNNKIKELEKEIIKSGKRSHSISHRQKILEHKLEELSMKSEISEMDIKSRIEKIGKDIRKEPVIVLAKTGIVEIDDVLNYMKSECLKKKIDFQLQLSGNIYKMINNCEFLVKMSHFYK